MLQLEAAAAAQANIDDANAIVDQFDKELEELGEEEPVHHPLIFPINVPIRDPTKSEEEDCDDDDYSENTPDKTEGFFSQACVESQFLAGQPPLHR